MTIKIILAAGAVLIIVLIILLFVLEPAATEDPGTAVATSTNSELNGSSTAITTTSTGATSTVGKLKIANFSGKLEEVDTGCFADGECYVVVDGKHVTVLRGWSQDTVGSIEGAASIGDLEGQIGATITVYAQDNSDGTYTLYGSEGFYVKVTEGINKAPTTAIPATGSKCVVGGCSSQLCVDEADGERLVLVNIVKYMAATRLPTVSDKVGDSVAGLRHLHLRRVLLRVRNVL